MNRYTVSLSAALVGLLSMQLLFRQFRPTSFSILPIFTPTSLDYETKMRENRDQKEGYTPLPAIQSMDYLLATERLTIEDSVLIDRLQQSREELLSLRQERHGLNIEMMDFAIELTQILNAAQWDFIQSNRDSLQAEVELEAYERVLDQLMSTPD